MVYAMKRLIPLLLLASYANADITLVGSTSGTNGNGADITLILPTHAADDVGVIIACAEGIAQPVIAVTSATGWNVLRAADWQGGTRVPK